MYVKRGREAVTTSVRETGEAVTTSVREKGEAVTTSVREEWRAIAFRAPKGVPNGALIGPLVT